ncbi:uncharacterized protein N7482_006020 [Penicillium canariense]|uniref:Rhodopsin domain-containing protein n=1 Tax=Penicillium canariense TaxID=189055 RepID=A0A9W9I5X1_9EURO|nr:uncharacterized protein N7482_006020 [Penicillium canariense]KAJ5167239.1 hypothetical protein N7482_006020 [Penicillium canariense]
MLSHDQIVILNLAWVLGSATILIMVLRLLMRKLRKQRLILGDYLTMLAILCVLARSTFATVVTLWGNNNYTETDQHFTATEIHQREVGSKLTLANRMLYNTYLWIQKSVILLLYNRIFSCLPFAARIIKVFWVVLFVTFCVVQATSFVDCRPVRLYWQILISFIASNDLWDQNLTEANIGDCTDATIQLFTFVSLNIATDGMLLIFPLPLIFNLRQCPLKTRLQLLGLFSLGILLTIIAVLRLPVYENGTSQLRRYIWGSIEQFCAALVANLPTLYSLRRRKILGPISTPHSSFSNALVNRSSGSRRTPEEELLDWPDFVESRRGSCRDDIVTEESSNRTDEGDRNV